MAYHALATTSRALTIAALINPRTPSGLLGVEESNPEWKEVIQICTHLTFWLWGKERNFFFYYYRNRRQGKGVEQTSFPRDAWLLYFPFSWLSTCEKKVDWLLVVLTAVFKRGLDVCSLGNHWSSTAGQGLWFVAPHPCLGWWERLYWFGVNRPVMTNLSELSVLGIALYTTHAIGSPLLK